MVETMSAHRSHATLITRPKRVVCSRQHYCQRWSLGRLRPGKRSLDEPEMESSIALRASSRRSKVPPSLLAPDFCRIRRVCFGESLGFVVEASSSVHAFARNTIHFPSRARSDGDKTSKTLRPDESRTKPDGALLGQPSLHPVPNTCSASSRSILPRELLLSRTTTSLETLPLLLSSFQFQELLELAMGTLGQAS